MGHEKGLSSVYAGEGRSGWNPWRQRNQLGRRGGPVLRQEGEGSARDTPEHSRSAVSAPATVGRTRSWRWEIIGAEGRPETPRDAEASDQTTSTSNVRPVDFGGCGPVI